jgi:hypothetical protein
MELALNKLTSVAYRERNPGSLTRAVAAPDVSRSETDSRRGAVVTKRSSNTGN